MNLVVTRKPNGRSYEFRGHLTEGWKLKDLDTGDIWDSIEEFESYETKKTKQRQMAKARAAKAKSKELEE